MVEKNSDDSVQEEPVIVAATRSFGEGLGTAIEIMETKLANSGVALQFQYPAPKIKEVATKLRFLPELIHLGILASIGSGVVTEESIGKGFNRNALVPGNLVALHNATTNCFLRIYNRKADFGGGKRPIDSLPLIWGSERFLVVDAGSGSIVLFSPCHRLFLGCMDKYFDASGYPIVNLDEKPRANESFRIKNIGNDKVRLHCDIEKGIVGVVGGGWNEFRVVEIHGFH